MVKSDTLVKLRWLENGFGTGAGAGTAHAGLPVSYDVPGAEGLGTKLFEESLGCKAGGQDLREYQSFKEKTEIRG